MDGGFEKLKNILSTVECNTSAANEYVSKAECSIRTVKERTRGLISMLPFNNIPWRMNIEFVYFIVLWLSAFPVKTGVSSIYSPRELLVRWRLDYKKHCRVLPGTYCKVHDKPLPSNMMVPRTHKGIALGPMGNLQGTVKFYCLKTGRVLKRRSFRPLPMPDSVIQQVNTIGLKEKQGRSFRFLNRQKEPYKWTNEVPEDDLEFQGLLKADAEEAAAYPDISAELPGVELTSKDDDYPAITEEPEADFKYLAVAAIDGIDTVAWLCAARDLADTATIGIAPLNPRAALVESNKDKIVYEITFDLPDAGLEPDIEPNIPPVQPGNATAVNVTNYDPS
jgi:hypothetical protein